MTYQRACFKGLKRSLLTWEHLKALKLKSAQRGKYIFLKSFLACPHNKEIFFFFFNDKWQKVLCCQHGIGFTIPQITTEYYFNLYELALISKSFTLSWYAMKTFRLATSCLLRHCAGSNILAGDVNFFCWKPGQRNDCVLFRKTYNSAGQRTKLKVQTWICKSQLIQFFLQLFGANIQGVLRYVGQRTEDGLSRGLQIGCWDCG